MRALLKTQTKAKVMSDKPATGSDLVVAVIVLALLTLVWAALVSVDITSAKKHLDQRLDALEQKCK